MQDAADALKRAEVMWDAKGFLVNVASATGDLGCIPFGTQTVCYGKLHFWLGDLPSYGGFPYLCWIARGDRLLLFSYPTLGM